MVSQSALLKEPHPWAGNGGGAWEGLGLVWAMGITHCLGVEAEPEMRVWVQMVYC